MNSDKKKIEFLEKAYADLQADHLKLKKSHQKLLKEHLHLKENTEKKDKKIRSMQLSCDICDSMLSSSSNLS